MEHKVRWSTTHLFKRTTVDDWELAFCQEYAAHSDTIAKAAKIDYTVMLDYLGFYNVVHHCADMEPGKRRDTIRRYALQRMRGLVELSKEILREQQSLV